jgi:hypothetical protein
MTMNLITLLLILTTFAFGATNTLTTTTLASAVTDTSGQIISVAAATGITANTTQIYVDYELMSVNSVSGTQIKVRRGAAGTVATTHASGAVVYVGLNGYFSFYDRGGSCTAATEWVLPVINTTNGNIWNCLSSGQWVLSGRGSMGSAGSTVSGFCTGTAGSAETEYLNGAACSGATTLLMRVIMTSPGTLANLRVFSSAAFTGGTNKDVITVYKNGSATALTCTAAAAATTCSDLTHSVVVAAGDAIGFQFVSATSDTAANVSASVSKF